MNSRALIGASVVVLAAACQSPEPPVVTDLAIPDRVNEHVAVASTGRFAAVTWAASTADGVMDIYAAFSRDAGRTFDAPVRVNDTPGDAEVNGEQPARVVLVPGSDGADPDVVVLWPASGTRGTRLATARSDDGGRSYSPAATVTDTDAPGNRGWQAMTADVDGRILAVWLDHRREAEAASVHPHEHAGSMERSGASVDTVAMAQLSDLYFSSLGADAEPRALTAGVCYCCKTAIAMGRDGAIHLAWRHVYPGDMRDMAFMTSRDAGRTFSPPVRISEDGWSIAGCPDDGPAMAVDDRGRVHVVWPTMSNVNGFITKAIYYAMTADGRTFTPRVQLPISAMAHHPSVAVAPDGSLAVAWDETGEAGRRVIRARGVIDDAGRATFERDATTDWPGRYPAVTAAEGRVLTAWTSTSGEQPIVRVESRANPE